MADLEKQFGMLEASGQNTVDHILPALEEAKVVGAGTKVTQQEARALLTTTSDGKVGWPHMLGVLKQLATANGMSLDAVKGKVMSAISSMVGGGGGIGGALTGALGI